MRIAIAALLLLGPAAAAAETRHRPILGVGVEERFDSAAFSGGESELMSKLSAEAGYALDSEVRTLEAAYAADLLHHLRGRNVTVDHRARLGFRDRSVERLELWASGQLFRVEDMTSLPRFGVARVRAPALWAWAEAGLGYRLTHTATGEIVYHGEATHLFTESYLLGTTHAAWMRLRLSTTRRLELGARLRGQLFLAGSARYADSLTPSVTARYALTRHSFVALEGGPLLYRSEAHPSTWLYRASGELGYEARGLLLGLSVGHDVMGAAGYASAVWADYIQAGATYRFTLAWSAFLGAGYYRNGRAPDRPADADGFTGSAGVEWKLARGFAMAATYDHLEQFGALATGLGLRRDIVSLRLFYRTP
ncbi:MAG: hypothetical protein HY901_02795 [Deltaproteobacteria bacterium]|nr:hypothetical protein [Deltaproteobacteria bacterium]